MLFLLLTVMAHIGVGFMLGIVFGGRQYATSIAQAAPTGILMVSLGKLNSPDIHHPVLPTSATVSGYGKPKEDLGFHPAMPAPSQSLHAETESILPISMQSEPHYFHSNELTEKPYMLQDALSDKILALPDVSPLPTVLRLSINENGDVDRIVIEHTNLSEQAERFFKDELANTKFQPGKIGHIPVNSELIIEVTLR